MLALAVDGGDDADGPGGDAADEELVAFGGRQRAGVKLAMRFGRLVSGVHGGGYARSG